MSNTPGNEGYYDPRARDPQFPDRPTHPDFFDLSDVVQGLDVRSRQASIPELAGVDMESFTYFVRQRLGVMAQATRGLIDPDDPLTQALYLDAFTVGKNFAEKRGAGSP